MIVLLRPVISEKSMKLASALLYTFEVDKDATKPQIKKAMEEQFKVDVLQVKTINVKGERKTQRRVRRFYQSAGFKKAIVKIKKGQTIPLFETAKKDEEVVVTTGEEQPVIVKERKDLFRRTKVRVEKGATGATPTTQRKVIPT